MTTISLLLWILLGIGLQLAIWLGAGFWQYWMKFRALKRGETAPEPQAAADSNPVRPAAWNGFRSFRVERKQIEDIAQSICSFYLAPEDGNPLPDFLPGQFLTFRMEILAATGNTQIVRCYSLSDAPHSGHYRISIKRMLPPSGSAFPPGRSSGYFHDRITVGSMLQVRAPNGHFYLDQGNSPIVLIGGGIGITPMLSMLNWCAAKQPEREIWLFYGVRNSREQIMKAHLEKLATVLPNFHLQLCFSDPLPEDQPGRDFQHHGRVSISLFREQLPRKPYHFYICGPAALMENLVTSLEEWGVPEEYIHFEAFGPASLKRTATAPPPEAGIETGNIIVDFIRSGKQITWQPSAGSLLELAEANGISLESGCRAGGCGTCQTRIQSGEVHYQQRPDFDPEAGTCLPCICTPKSSLALEA